MKFLFKLALTCAALWLAFHNVAWPELKDAFRAQQAGYLWVAILMLLLQTLCGGLRWHAIRRALGNADSALHTARLYYASNLFNIGLPSTLGSDVARIWLAKKSGGRVKDIVYGVIIDRAFSLVGIGLLIISTLCALFPYFTLSVPAGIIVSIICAVLFVAGYALLRMLLPRLSHTRLPWLNDVFSVLTRVLGQYRHVASSLLWAALAHVFYSTAAYALALSLGIEISWLACIVLVPLVMLVTALPITIGGWGIREMGMTGVLALAGVAHAPALALSLQIGLLTAVVSLSGGLAYLSLRK